jgi:hypothetical protein
MIEIRQGEQGHQVPERTERFFQKESYWYYTTREGVSIGPFDHLTDARVGCSDFIDFITGAGTSFVSTLEEYGRNVA